MQTGHAAVQLMQTVAQTPVELAKQWADVIAMLCPGQGAAVYSAAAT